MPWDDYFKGKSFIVTGAGRSIGRAIAKKLDEAGATVYAVAKTPTNLATLKSECERVETIPVDLSDWNAAREAIGKIGPVDGLVNCAGIVEPANFMTVTPEDLDAMYSINFKAMLNVCQVVGGKMIERGTGGVIINMSSVAGLVTPNYLCAYSCMKVAVQQLTKLMTVELGPYNIRVNALCPGCVASTDMLAHLFETLPGVPDGLARFNSNYAELIPNKKPTIEISEVVNTAMFLMSGLAPSISGTITAIDAGAAVA